MTGLSWGRVRFADGRVEELETDLPYASEGHNISKLKVYATEVSDLPSSDVLESVLAGQDRLKSRIRVNVELLQDAIELEREFAAAITDRDTYREEARGLLQRLDASRDSEVRLQQQLNDYRQFIHRLLQGFGLKADVPSPTASREQLQAYLVELARLIQAQRQPVPGAQPAEWPTALIPKEVGLSGSMKAEDQPSRFTFTAAPEKKGLKPCSDPNCSVCDEQQ